MKLKTNIDPQVFVDSHGYIEQLWIHYQDEISHFSPTTRQVQNERVIKDDDVIKALAQMRGSTSTPIHGNPSIKWRGSAIPQDEITSTPSPAEKNASKNLHFGGYYFALRADGGMIYIVNKDGILFIFQCSNEASAAQVKMEIENFISGCEIKGKYRGFFSSIFKR